MGLSASVLCSPLIDGTPRPLAVAHRSRQAWQLADPSTGRVLASLVDRAAVRLPHAFVVARLPRATTTVTVGSGALWLDGRPMRVRRWFQPCRPHLPEVASLARDAAAIDEGMRFWWARLGLGDGLTPYADDVLCGGLVTMHAAGLDAACPWGHMVSTAALEQQTTAVSAALLRLAAEGWCIDQLGAALTPLRELSRCRRASTGLHPESSLAKVGSSSGRGLWEGVRIVLDVDVGRRAA